MAPSNGLSLYFLFVPDGVNHYQVKPHIVHENLDFFFQAEDGIRDYKVTGVLTCALPICLRLLTGGQGYGNGDISRSRGLSVRTLISLSRPRLCPFSLSLSHETPPHSPSRPYCVFARRPDRQSPDRPQDRPLRPHQAFRGLLENPAGGGQAGRRRGQVREGGRPNAKGTKDQLAADGDVEKTGRALKLECNDGS